MGRRLYVDFGGGATTIAAAMIARAAAPEETAAFALVQDAPVQREGLVPWLSGGLGTDLHVLDVHETAADLAAQLSQVVQLTGANEVAVVDVGGALVAAGRQTSCQEADAGALILDAVSGLEVPGVVLVTGLGVDGAGPRGAVVDRLTLLGAERWLTVGAEHVHPFSSVLESVVSEPAGLLSLAAGGWRGWAERHSPWPPAELTERTAVVYRVDAPSLGRRMRADDVAGAPRPDPTTRPLHPTGPRMGTADRGADSAGAPLHGSFPDALARLDEYGQAAVSRGVAFLTMHRVAEVLGLTPHELRAFRRALRTSRCPRYAGSGWSLLPSSMTGSGVASNACSSVGRPRETPPPSGACTHGPSPSPTGGRNPSR